MQRQWDRIISFSVFLALLRGCPGVGAILLRRPDAPIVCARLPRPLLLSFSISPVFPLA